MDWLADRTSRAECILCLLILFSSKRNNDKMLRFLPMATAGSCSCSSFKFLEQTKINHQSNSCF